MKQQCMRTTGPSENDDIAFHFNARMDRKVVMNSFRNRGWEAEESVSDNPFKKGQPFEMFIVVKSEGYVVCVLRHKTCSTHLKGKLHIWARSYSPYKIL
uniref:Galectin n=1 Tax=Sinocyclocheilus rhinocerous TaxID=307959 RepID=A0A673N3L3_9TELE